MNIVAFPGKPAPVNPELLRGLTNGLLDLYNPLANNLGNIDRASTVCFETYLTACAIAMDAIGDTKNATRFCSAVQKIKADWKTFPAAIKCLVGEIEDQLSCIE